MAVVLPNIQDTGIAQVWNATCVRDDVDWFALGSLSSGTGVITGAAVTAPGSTMQLSVAAGTVVVNGSQYSFSTTASAATTIGAASTSDRRDTVVYTVGTGISIIPGGPCGFTTGNWTTSVLSSNPPVKQYVTGTYAVPANSVILAEVYVAGSGGTATTASNLTTANNIVDKRNMLTTYIGSWAGPGAPASGTFSVGQYGLDLATPALWVCTTSGTVGSGAVFQNLGASTNLFSALNLSLTNTVAYTPTAATKGNTAFLASQNETLSFLPPVSALSANGTLWTVTFNANIIGSGTSNTLGVVGDTFPCWLAGFTNSGGGTYAGTNNAAISTLTTLTLNTTASTLGFANVPTTAYNYTPSATGSNYLTVTLAQGATIAANSAVTGAGITGTAYVSGVIPNAAAGTSNVYLNGTIGTLTVSSYAFSVPTYSNNATVVTSGGTIAFTYTGVSGSTLTGCVYSSAYSAYTVATGAAIIPSWNAGNSLSTLTATVTSQTTVTIPHTDSPSSTLSVYGVCQTNPVQYTSFTTGAGLQYPRALSEIEGFNTFKASVSSLYGLGPAYQNAMTYLNAMPYAPSNVTCTNGSNVYTIPGDQRANISPNAKIVGTNVPSNSVLTNLTYDGTKTNCTAYVAGTFTPSSFTGTTGTYTITFTADISTGESFVSAPTTIANTAAVQFPTNPSNFLKPGQGQGWATGYWSGPVFGASNGGTLSNIQVADFLSELFLTTGTSAVTRWGYLFDDVASLPTQGGGGTLATQIGMYLAHVNSDLSTDQAYGATTNVGIFNQSTEYGPTMTPQTTLTAAAVVNSGAFLGGTGSLTVSSTNGFPSIGTVKIPYTNGSYTFLTYTSTTATTFAGCTWYAGQSALSTVTTAPIGTAVLGCVAGNNGAAIPVTCGATFTLPTPMTTKMRLISNSAVTSTTAQVITGTPYADGQKLTLVNVGTFNITFNTGGTTGLVFAAPTAYILAPKQSVSLRWDVTLSAWIQDNQSSLLQQARVVTVNAPTANPTWNSDVTDVLYLTGMTVAISSMTQNWSGTPYAGQQLTIIFLDNGTARSLTWGSRFQSSGTVTLPTTTNGSTVTVLSCDFIWNAAAASPSGQWRIVRSTT